MSQTAAPTRTRQILIVEDDKAIYHAMQALLQHYEYEVKLATTLAEARGMMQEQPAFILLDLQLPDGNGADFLQELRAKRNTAGVAVITACEDLGMLRRVQNLKPDLLMKKPVNFLELLARLKPVL